jgi:hypothetical protein
MTPDLQEAESIKYVAPRVSLFRLSSGRIVVMTGGFKIVEISPPPGTTLNALLAYAKAPTAQAAAPSYDPTPIPGLDIDI